jgi:predicted GNAT superfamily acetyltransferase
MVVVLSDNCGYTSEFYRWFTDRYTNFLYIDRIVVTAWVRGRGVPKALYQAIEQAAREQRMAIVSDVYSEPPNTPSLHLHRSRGFEEVGKQHFPAQQKTATKFMKYVEHARTASPRTGS